MLLEPTNEAYAIAKIAGLKCVNHIIVNMVQNTFQLMPTTLYGPNDNFDLHTSHVLPALIRKFHEAKESNAPFVEVWGTGTPKTRILIFR